MTAYALINELPGLPYRPGATVTDATDNISQLLAAGAILLPLPDAQVQAAQQAAVAAFARGAGEWVAAGIMQRVYARYLASTAVWLDVAGTGTLTPDPLALQAPTIVCTGALTGDRVVVVPATEGWGAAVANHTSGAWLLGFRAAGGSRVLYLLPGQRKRIFVAGGEAYALDEESVLAKLAIDLTGAAGTTDAKVLRLPSTTTLTRLLLRGSVAPVGGTVNAALGLTSGGAELLTLAAVPAPGVLQGETSGWGASMPSGASYDGGGAAFDVYLRLVRSAPITAGSLTVYAMGSRTP